MGKKIVNILVFTVLCAILYLLFKGMFRLIAHFMHRSSLFVYLLGYSIVLTFYILGITYGWLWNKTTMQSRGKKILLITISILLSVVVFPSAIMLWQNSSSLYNYVVSDNVNGWVGKIHEPDDTLGFRTVPGATGTQTMRFGKVLPMHYSREGFRAPVSKETTLDSASHAGIIFFGCSCTYGAGCLEEDTYPHVVATRDSLSYINAGVCSYGLSHMYILAQRLIPKYKPRYVVLQYSQWLVQRGVSLYAPSNFGLVTNPYFSMGDGKVALRQPIFKTQAFFDKKELREKYAHNRLGFIFGFGFPYYINDFFNSMSAKFKQATNSDIKPATDNDAVEKYIYNEMARIATENGAQVIIFNYGDSAYSKRSKNIIAPRYHPRFAEGDSMLYAYLEKSPTKNYQKEFGHWGFNGKDSIFVDAHPNPRAHELMAESILLKLK